MKTEQVLISNKLGLHARASSKLVELAMQFDAEICLERSGRCANAKSLMSVMMLAANKGSNIIISANGSDEDEAMRQILELFANKFGEPE